MVNLFNHGSGQIPWQLHNKWTRCYLAKGMRVVVSHIVREGNAFADKLASRAARSQEENGWNIQPFNLAFMAYSDHVGLPFYSFKNS